VSAFFEKNDDERKVKFIGSGFGSCEDNFLKWRRSKGRVLAPMMICLLKERVGNKLNGGSENDFLKWKRSWSVFLLGTWMQFLMFMKNNYIRRSKQIKKMLENYFVLLNWLVLIMMRWRVMIDSVCSSLLEVLFCFIGYSIIARIVIDLFFQESVFGILLCYVDMSLVAQGIVRPQIKIREEEDYLYLIKEAKSNPENRFLTCGSDAVDYEPDFSSLTMQKELATAESARMMNVCLNETRLGEITPSEEVKLILRGGVESFWSNRAIQSKEFTGNMAEKVLFDCECFHDVSEVNKILFTLKKYSPK
jgi:hypothetical protein